MPIVWSYDTDSFTHTVPATLFWQAYLDGKVAVSDAVFGEPFSTEISFTYSNNV